jgi:hypothetical protein
MGTASSLLTFFSLLMFIVISDVGMYSSLLLIQFVMVPDSTCVDLIGSNRHFVDRTYVTTTSERCSILSQQLQATGDDVHVLAKLDDIRVS